MGDKKKLKTGLLGVNVMEEQELCKHVNRLKRRTDTVVTEIEAEQTRLAKKFLRFLSASANLAKQHENTVRSFSHRKATVLETSQDNRLARKRAGILRSDSESEGGLKAWQHDDIGLKKSGQTSSYSTLALRQKNEKFQVPYKRISSYKTSELARPTTVLDMRCEMWQRVTYCTEKAERTKSAPPRAGKSAAGKNAAPARVQIAHKRALKFIGMREAMVFPPSNQPQIDRNEVWKLREGEILAEKQAVQQFANSLKPFKLKPGPTQVVFDANKLYGELARVNGRYQKH